MLVIQPCTYFLFVKNIEKLRKRVFLRWVEKFCSMLVIQPCIYFLFVKNIGKLKKRVFLRWVEKFCSMLVIQPCIHFLFVKNIEKLWKKAGKCRKIRQNILYWCNNIKWIFLKIEHVHSGITAQPETAVFHVGGTLNLGGSDRIRTTCYGSIHSARNLDRRKAECNF